MRHHSRSLDIVQEKCFAFRANEREIEEFKAVDVHESYI